jgi:hypothetical protein
MSGFQTVHQRMIPAIHKGQIIASTLHDADLIWIFGPGEAKIELENYMKNHAFCGKITNVEPADKLTDKQVTSKVRQYFKENRS